MRLDFVGWSINIEFERDEKMWKIEIKVAKRTVHVTNTKFDISSSIETE